MKRDGAKRNIEPTSGSSQDNVGLFEELDTVTPLEIVQSQCIELISLA